MPALDFGPVELPNLDDTTLFPVVEHGASCVDAQPFDTKSCHATPLTKVRPYAFVTEPLGRLKQSRALHPILPPFPPSLGTHCPTITQEIDVDVADAASVESSVSLRNGDACRPSLIQSLKMPCTVISVTGGASTGFPTGMSVSATNNRDNKQCGVSMNIGLTMPTSGGSGFVVGTEDDMDSPYQDACCVVSYLPGAEVPVVDKAGILGPVNEELDPDEHEIINASKEPMVNGDEITLEQAAVQTGARILWKAFFS